MATTRRSLLGAGAAALLAGCSGDDPPAAVRVAPGPSFDPLDWASVQAQFPLDPAYAPFAAWVLSPHPAPLDAAIAGYRERLATDTEAALLEGLELEDAVRAAAAAYAGGEPRQYALTDSTTMGIATMYGGLALGPHEEVLSTTHDFYSTEAALRLLTARTGARVRRVTLYDEPAAASVEEMIARLVAGVTPRTRVVALTWVHSSTGVRVPVAEIAAALADAGVRDRITLCVDGVHGFSAVDVDLPDLGCDFLATGTHKWLFGPRGTGVLWGRDFGRLTELIPTFTGSDRGGLRLTPGGYKCFEHQWAMADAFAFMGSIGRDRLVARTVEQATRLKEGLAGPTLRTPLDPAASAGIVCLDVPGMLPANAVLALREAGITASATPYAVSYTRLGPSIATSPEQVDAAVDAVTALL